MLFCGNIISPCGFITKFSGKNYIAENKINGYIIQFYIDIEEAKNAVEESVTKWFESALSGVTFVSDE